jgi:penicillin-binding protein 1C
MEIDLTALWEKITYPFRYIKYKLTSRPRSRRRLRSHHFSNAFSNVSELVSPGRPLSASERKLRMIKILRLLAMLALAAVVVGLIIFFALFAWVSKDLPKPGQVVRTQGYSTKLFDRNGKLLYDLYQDERRDPITIDQIPTYLKQATVSIEDKDFYKHGGVDPLTPFRIIYNFIFRRGRVVGGSTLTQQLVKNSLLTNERSLMRKFKEFVLALQLERKFTKDQILEMYFNETPYGGNSAGVGAASEIYFGKPVSQLNLVESAILAGLPQSPTAYSPFLGKKDKSGTLLWKARALGVLRRMNEDGEINKDVYNQAAKDLDSIQFNSPQSSIQSPHFVFYVRDILEKQFGQDVVNRGGLQVTTTLDLPLQEQAQKIVVDEIAKVTPVHITNGAAMVLNPKTGEILSMIGSVDYNSTTIDGKFNVAVDGLRQPGSSIKPVTYLALFRKGYTPAHMLVDAPTIFQQVVSEKPYEPQNYENKFFGPMSVRNSLGNSMNVNSVKALALVGLPDFLQLAHTMGFPTLEPTTENMKRFGLSVTLGGGEVHLIDTVSAYSAFANGGLKVSPVAILKVTDAQGHVLFDYKHVDGERVMSPEEAFLIDSILSDNSARTIAFGTNSLLNTGKAIAVKTGTTNDKKDNWAIGWSQNFMVGVWVGNNDATAMKQVASGISGASPIWRNIVNAMIKEGYKVPDWTVPEGVEKVKVDNVSGYPEHDGYASHEEYIIKGTLPSLPDPVHTKLKVCRGDNKLATDAKIASGDYDEKEYLVLKEEDPYSKDGVNRWQAGIVTWIASQSDDKYKPPTEYCGSTSDLFVRLNQPEDKHKYDKEEVEVNAESDSGDGIAKMELWIDGSLKETINDRTYKGKIHLPPGRHEVFVKAFGRGGQVAQSGTAHIGTGGQDWQAPQPTATPSPSPSSTPNPTPSPSPLPSILP